MARLGLPRLWLLTRAARDPVCRASFLKKDTQSPTASDESRRKGRRARQRGCLSGLWQPGHPERGQEGTRVAKAVVDAGGQLRAPSEGG